MTSTESPVRFTFTGRDGTVITAYRWEPSGAPRASVGFDARSHGLCSRVGRFPSSG